MTKWGRHLILGNAALALAACAHGASSRPNPPQILGRDSAESRVGQPRPAQTRPASTRPTTTLPYSFDKAPTPPVLLNTGTDIVAIVKSLMVYASWIEAHDPNVARVADYAAPRSLFERTQRHDLQILRRLHRRLFETENGPRRVSIVDGHLPEVMTARYTQHLVRQSVVDPSGHVTSKRDFVRPTTSYVVLIVKMLDGHWMLADSVEEAPR